jgi:hypothetical protein
VKPAVFAWRFGSRQDFVDDVAVHVGEAEVAAAEAVGKVIARNPNESEAAPMPANETKRLVGSRCVAGPGGRWGLATIRRANEDGTFKIEFDVKEMTLMPYWHGVTSAEISFDEAPLWASVFARISPNSCSLGRADFGNALSLLGWPGPDEQAQRLWDDGCQKRFDVSEAQAESLVLDEAGAYQLFLHLGISAKLCAENLMAEKSTAYFKLYWNQNRMGGRQPAELPRPATLEDAFAALGIVSNRVDASSAAFLQRFEREQGVRLPGALMKLLQRTGVAKAVAECHPNNPSLVEFIPGEWKLRRGMRQQQLSGDCAITIMVPHQGDHEWVVVFDENDDDARVYVHWNTDDGEAWLPTAPGIGMFFWDLAQTGLAWYQDTRFKGGKPVRRSDLGLVLDA